MATKVGWEGDQVRFECADTGPGIPKSEQERLFQRFVQRGGVPGTGLGLAIAKHVIQAHGGEIWAESVEGQGSTFYFTLPIACADFEMPLSAVGASAVDSSPNGAKSPTLPALTS